jgi:hypothetical protein
MLSQSASVPAGAGTMCTAFTSHAPPRDSGTRTRPAASLRIEATVSPLPWSAITSAPASGLPS